MSVFITAKYTDCIQVLTDAAVYTPEGRLVGIEDKCWYSHKLPLAVTGRGATAPVEKLAQLIIGLADRSADMSKVVEFLEFVPNKLREWLPLLDENQSHFEFVAAYFSEQEGFVQKALWTHQFNGAAPFEWNSMEGWMIGAPDIPRESEVERMAEQINPANDPRFLPTFGAQLVDLMREDLTRAKADMHPGAEWLNGSSVGGHVRLTTVTRTSVVSEVLKTYNDVIGEPINPYRDAGNITPISNLQKRRLEKKKAKTDKRALRRA